MNLNNKKPNFINVKEFLKYFNTKYVIYFAFAMILLQFYNII